MEMRVFTIFEAILFGFVGTSFAYSDCAAVERDYEDLLLPGQQLSISNLTVICRGKNLPSISNMQLESSYRKAISIDLGNNSIHTIEGNVFSKLTNLKALILDQNFIEDVSVASFNVSGTIGKSKPVSPLELINLTDNHLHYFPACFGRTNEKIATFDNLETLLIGGNLFGDHLEMESFAGIRNLRKLDMSRCLIRVVSELTFKMLPRLQFLDLSGNNIREISRMIFAQDIPLKKLKLQGNELTEFPKNLPRDLKELDLSSNNIISFHKQDYESFRRLENLQILDLKRNQIVHLQPRVFRSLSQLLYLDLSNNLLEVIEAGTFDGLRSLEFLLLNDNRKFRRMNDLEFSILPQLQHLFLHSCLLETFVLGEINENPKTTIYPPLKNVWLFDNPLTCDCKILPLVKFLKQQKVNLDADINLIVADLNGTTVAEKLSKIKRPGLAAVCTKPLNRHYNVVGIPILNVPESYLTCPDEPLYIAISCFLGIVAFLGVIPIVFLLILGYLFILRFVQTYFGCAKVKED